MVSGKEGRFYTFVCIQNIDRLSTLLKQTVAAQIAAAACNATGLRPGSGSAAPLKKPLTIKAVFFSISKLTEYSVRN